MIVADVPIVAEEYTAYTETWYGAEQAHSPYDNYEGTDFSTWIVHPNASSYYASNQFTSFLTNPPPTTSTDTFTASHSEDDYGSVYSTRGYTGTFYYATFSGGVSGGGNGSITNILNTYYGYISEESSYTIEGGDTEWSWTLNITGDTRRDYEYGTSYNSDLSLDPETFATHSNYTSSFSNSGHGVKPPGGYTYWSTAEGTEAFGVSVPSTITQTGTIIAGTVINSVPTTFIDYSTYTDLSSNFSTIAVPNISLFRRGFLDPDNVYGYSRSIIPESRIGQEEWAWTFALDEPGGLDPSETHEFTDLYHSVDGEIAFLLPPRFFNTLIMPQIDASQDFVTYTVTYTDFSEDVTNGSYINYDDDTGNHQSITLYSGVIGSLPMGQTSESFVFVPTKVYTFSDYDTTATYYTDEDWATRTIFSISSPPGTRLVTVFLEYLDDQSQNNTTSYEDTENLPGYIVADNTTYNDSVYITDSFTGQFHGTNGTRTISDVGDLTTIQDIDTNFVAMGEIGTNAVGYKPSRRPGFQIQPRVATTDPVYTIVSADNQISTFDGQFFPLVFAGDISAPYGLYYRDSDGGVTGNSVTGDYSLSFPAHSDDTDGTVGQILVTSQSGDTSDAVAYTVNLTGGGNAGTETVYNLYFISGGTGGEIVVGGLPQYGGGANTVYLDGYFRVTNNNGPDMYQRSFLGSFVMATDDISVLSANSVYWAGPTTGTGLDPVGVRVFQKHIED